MEKLLNKLIEKGWKPRGEDVKVLNTGVDTFNERIVRFKTNKGGFKSWGGTYRELVSKESGLWQFVCENGMVKPVVDIISICSYSHFTDDHDDGGWDETFPEYRLIESSLKDESELEDFLLQNIKING